MIFGVLNHEKIWHQQLVQLPTSPVYCSHFTLGNPKKSFFNSIIHTYFRLFTLSHKKTTQLLLHHPPHLKNVTAQPCKMHKFFIFSIFHAYQVPSIRDMDELRKRLVATWAEFQQSVVDDAVDQ